MPTDPAGPQIDAERVELVPVDPTSTSAELVHDVEQRAVLELPLVDDAGLLVEWLRRADALAAYLAGKEGHPSALGLERHIETRIGQLLGPAPGRGHSEMNQHADSFHPQTRGELRELADAVDHALLVWEELEPWQVSRRHLLAYARGEALKPDLDGVKGSTGVEWYTPAEYVDAAREILGGTIDVDPASSDIANQTVRAINYHTEHDDGLTVEWPGTVWLNPPYGKQTGQFVAKLVEEVSAGRTTAAVLLINAYGFDAGWWRPLWDHTICFTDHRIIFTSPQRGTGGPANGNVFVYIGPDAAGFAERFSEFGVIVRRWPA